MSADLQLDPWLVATHLVGPFLLWIGLGILLPKIVASLETSLWLALLREKKVIGPALIRLLRLASGINCLPLTLTSLYLYLTGKLNWSIFLLLLIAVGLIRSLLYKDWNAFESLVEKWKRQNGLGRDLSLSRTACLQIRSLLKAGQALSCKRAFHKNHTLYSSLVLLALFREGSFTFLYWGFGLAFLGLVSQRIQESSLSLSAGRRLLWCAVPYILVMFAMFSVEFFVPPLIEFTLSGGALLCLGLHIFALGREDVNTVIQSQRRHTPTNHGFLDAEKLSSYQLSRDIGSLHDKDQEIQIRRFTTLKNVLDTSSGLILKHLSPHLDLFASALLLVIL